jgi:diguanylate cyclase
MVTAARAPRVQVPWTRSGGPGVDDRRGLVVASPWWRVAGLGVLVGERAVVVAQLRGEAARLRSEVAQAWELAYTDELTGLGNRRALLDHLGPALAAGGSVGLLVADLDGFKAVNDTHGHPVGDHVLRVVAARLIRAAGPGCLVARLGGDEFAITTGEVDRLDQVTGDVRAALGAPMTAGQVTVTLTASVGAAIHRSGDTPPQAGGTPGPRKGRVVVL